jgi:hypothetical protein
MSKAINEAGFSLLPNLGISGQTVKPGGTVGTTSSMGLNTPGSKTQQLVKTTAATTKQINDLVAKIATQKQKAAQANTPEQQALLQSVNILQKQLQQLVTPSQQEAEETTKKKIKRSISNNMATKAFNVKEGVTGVIKKGVGGAAGGMLGKVVGTAVGGPVGGIVGSVLGTGAGAEVMDDDEESHKKMKKKKKKYPVKEAILPAIGGAASTAVKTAGNVAGMVPVVGAPVKAAADLAGDVATGILGGGENEENPEKLTAAQEEVVNALSKRKYWVNKVSYQFADQEGGPTVFMMKKPNHYTTHYAEIDPDGTVNGESLESFLGGREENEEKLTPKQQRIARLAGDKEKIDTADFAKLRAMKEATELCKYADKGCKCNKCKECKSNQSLKEEAEIPVFLKAILQKNYAQADKYLGSLINGKIKNLINTALDKTL